MSNISTIIASMNEFMDTLYLAPLSFYRLFGRKEALYSRYDEIIYEGLEQLGSDVVFDELFDKDEMESRIQEWDFITENALTDKETLRAWCNDWWGFDYWEALRQVCGREKSFAILENPIQDFKILFGKWDNIEPIYKALKRNATKSSSLFSMRYSYLSKHSEEFVAIAIDFNMSFEFIRADKLIEYLEQDEDLRVKTPAPKGGYSASGLWDWRYSWECRTRHWVAPHDQFGNSVVFA